MWKKRTNLAVNNTGSKNSLLGRSCFTFDVSTGDLANCILLLFIIDGQREKVDSVTW